MGICCTFRFIILILSLCLSFKGVILLEPVGEFDLFYFSDYLSLLLCLEFSKIDIMEAF